ncbi:hypothetical protein FHU38_004385 [Saccharomonospora amisosensis]|uniref:DUF1707 domain-containing protein n=1 Tax=Saccharomonospora amisosensis TaxID=1128677 RepID=A0A7X5UTP4_9PSEU|nr:DUF1707 domain-containing protein [Saccharomonospora amisosensis]NIJ14041.1 hypothetical protein [Saccharomonospora amisosensis]
MAVDRPEYRLSDAERREALDALSEHVRSGRLDLVEFEQRSGQVSAAKLRGELEPIFADLPEPRPSVLHTVRTLGQPRQRGEPPQPWSQRVAASAVPIAAIVALVLFFTIARGMVFVFLLPAVVALLAGSLASNRRRGP